MSNSSMRTRGAPRGAWPWMGVLALGLAGTLLGGCASAPGAGEGQLAEMTTESDEPPARRRARIRLELAVGYFEQGRTEIALDEVKQALVADPAYAAAFNLRGLVYMRLNDMKQAEDSLRRAVALDPRDSDAHHNYAWLLCQQGRFDESFRMFRQALANPLYGGRAKTYMGQGLCQARAGRNEDAEQSLARSYELDAANPVTGYNLAALLLRRGELQRAQFYIRRLNNSEMANAESLWLGIRVEERVGDSVAREQLGDQLRRRFPQSRELALYEKGAFNE
jgi:type IV pilus assembly protein PilF